MRLGSVFLAAAATLISASDSSRDGIASLDRHGFVDMYIGLEPEARHQLQHVLYAVSDPHHADYGKYLSRDEAKALLQPPAEAAVSVKRWLIGSGVDVAHIENRGYWIYAKVPSHMARSHEPTTSSHAKRTNGHPMELNLPDDVRRYVSGIHRMSVPGSAIAKKSPRAIVNREVSKVKRDEGCIENFTPACIHEEYRMPDPPAIPHSKTLFGVAGFLNQTAQYDQLEEFIRRFAPYAEGGTFTEDLVNGGENPQGEYPSGEANLDIQYAMALSYNISVSYISVGGGLYDFIPDLDMYDPTEAYVEPFLELATHLLDLPDEDLPQVVSISYSMNEQVMPPDYARQTCDTFGLLGTRGVSVLSSAGNIGPGASCQSNDGTNTTKFLPLFPAACPYVTSVGATEGGTPEKAFDFSGGGFSEYFERPAWQDDVVEAYLADHGAKWQGYYNPGGRAYPDVSARGWGYPIMNHGEVQITGGTSAATPVFGAMIALINNERFHKGKPPMGFLNPWIWNIGHLGFTDITEGKSVGCEGESLWGFPSPVIPGAGWDAVEGWDPVTGMGTPLFDRLRKLACT